MLRYQRAALLLLTVAAAACESAPTAPVRETDGPDVSFGTGETGEQRSGPLLSRLFQQAIARVRAENGEEAATRATEEYRRLALAARAARAAGDAETARAKMQEARVAAARVVARVFPTAPERVLGSVAEQLAKLDQRIAAAEASGAAVARPKAVAQRVARLHAAATEELRQGRRAPALLHGTRAADLLAALHRR